MDQYLAMELAKDQDGISSFIHKRFHERYVQPFDDNKNKNGFIMMASACLMIETLESFQQGWRKSPNSASAFCQFFDRNNRFSCFRGHAQQFYTHVRCGIMHQAETTGGWHIRRDLGMLFDSSKKIIDATVFLREMGGTLNDYCSRLSTAPWEGEEWKKLRKKMKSICANTAPKT